MSRLIVAIDGPVGSGKSTVARRVAELLGYAYLDSGAMYRAVAWKALRENTPFDCEEKLEALAGATRIDLVSTDGSYRVLVDGTDVTEPIRTAAVAQAASKVAVVAGVRTVLVSEQRRAARKRRRGDGRPGHRHGGLPRRRAENFSGCRGGGASGAAAAGTRAKGRTAGVFRGFGRSPAARPPRPRTRGFAAGSARAMPFWWTTRP